MYSPECDQTVTGWGQYPIHLFSQECKCSLLLECSELWLGELQLTSVLGCAMGFMVQGLWVDLGLRAILSTDG